MHTTKYVSCFNNNPGNNDISENDLPSMEPVLTNITLYHEARHVIWQATQAVHWNRCHSELCVCELIINLYFEDVRK